MQKMADKKIIIGICATVAVIVATVIILLVNKEEAFRSILVYEVEGTAVIERESVGSMNAAENLYLESGDRVSIGQDSSMRMKLDDDKYVMAEADTIFSIVAKGTDVNSKTKICLEQGAITNEIQNPLSKDSEYETSTPNSVMAVRGTIYRAEIFTDENGNQNTKMCCFQGKVETKPILPDGTYGEEVLVPAGSELTVYSDGIMSNPRDIVYEELPVQALQTLKKLLESGQSMEGVTLEYVEELINKEADISEESEENVPEQTVQPEPEENSKQGDADAEADVTDKAKNVSTQTNKNVKKNSETTQMAEEQPEQKPEPQEEAQPKVSETINNVNSDNAEGDSSQDGNTNNSDNNNEQDDSKSDNNMPDNNKPDNDEPVEPPKAVTYTVTFEYNGKTFATQEVKSGENVSKPLLAPAASGDWDFDFVGTRIEADTTIKWKS